MTYSELVAGLSVAQRAALAEHAGTIGEYLSQAGVYQKQGLSIKDFVSTSMADRSGVWPDSETAKEDSKFDDPMDKDMAALLDQLDEQLQTE